MVSYELNWFNLPDSLCVELKDPKFLNLDRKIVTIQRLKSIFGKDKKINFEILSIFNWRFKNYNVFINFPLDLGLDYVKLYALMVSEGSYKTEFSLNVPELEFHQMFKESIKNFVSKDVAKLISYDYNKGFLRSRAPIWLRNLIPLPDSIPFLIKDNKEFSREYLRVAFEAEGSAILNKNQYKRYLKLSRYVDITHFVLKEELPLMKRIYINNIKKFYPVLFEKIKDYSPKLLKDENFLLKKYFDIDSKMTLEAIRANKTGFRCGKITARWTLLIYANNIDKFINEIGFLAKNKNNILNEMKKFNGNNPQYSSLKIVNQIADNKGYFYRKKFAEEMKLKGYKSPSCFLWRYCKKGIIKRIKRGYYQISL